MKTQKKKSNKYKYILPIMVVLAVISLIIMLSVIFTRKAPEQSSFVPPPFETDAQSGIPDVPNGLGYSEIYQNGMEYSVWLCGNIINDKNNADVYFTNTTENNVWLKLRVLDESGNILGETGLLKPGEYVKSIKLNTILKVGTKIKLKIMAYEPETYHSAGAISLNTTIGSQIS